MERLKALINNRSVFVLLHGQSIQRLEYHIEGFKDYDICYASINKFMLIQKYFLDKIGASFDIIDCTSQLEFVRRVIDIEKFLSEGEKRLFITTLDAISYVYKSNVFLDKFRERVFITDEPLGEDRVNSLSMLLPILINGGASKIFLFGVDGCKEGQKETATYYRSSEMMSRPRGTRIGIDTTLFNLHYERLQKLHCKGKIPPIYNCNPDSHIKTFEKIKYDDIKQLLY